MLHIYLKSNDKAMSTSFKSENTGLGKCQFIGMLCSQLQLVNKGLKHVPPWAILKAIPAAVFPKHATQPTINVILWLNHFWAIFPLYLLELLFLFL